MQAMEVLSRFYAEHDRPETLAELQQERPQGVETEVFAYGRPFLTNCGRWRYTTSDPTAPWMSCNRIQRPGSVLR